jgi:hypothetical protein
MKGKRACEDENEVHTTNKIKKSEESDEEKVFNLILQKCLIPSEEAISPSVGVVLGSKSSKISIRALRDPTHYSIRGVPLDHRDSCKVLLLDSLDRPETSGRVHLLCSAAFAGSGKTVLQALNMQWFVNKTKGSDFQ